MTDYQTFLANKKCAEPTDPYYGPSLEEFNADLDMPKGSHYIYALHDPRTGELRYIGKSDQPRERLAQHLREDRGTHRCNWVQSIRRTGLAPVMAIIDAAASGTDWAWLERTYIAAARADGCELTNATDGGEGVPGLPPETRERMIAAQRGRKHTLETRARMSAAKKGRRHSEEWKQLMREIFAGRPLNRECAEANQLRMQKLTDAQVREIRHRVRTGERRVLLAKEFEVSIGTISNIVIGRTYGHVLDEMDD